MMQGVDPKALFSMYMRLVGTPCLEPEKGDPELSGKVLGIINGSSWITLWSYYFGRTILPGVKLVNVGNEAVQLNFMKAYREGKPCPPQENIEVFVRYALDLVELYRPDAILISCSTMNRAYPKVQEAIKQYGVPVVPIDMPMMEEAVARVEEGGTVLIIATHGPTVRSTQLLLEEVARKANKRNIKYVSETVEEAFERLGVGDIEGHNDLIRRVIEQRRRNGRIDVVVLAQLSMSVLKIFDPQVEEELGIPILTSGECGFRKIRALFIGKSQKDSVQPEH